MRRKAETGSSSRRGIACPNLPPSHAGSYLEERTFPKLIGPLGGKPSVWAECAFVDPVADLAALVPPDSQALGEEAQDFESLMETVQPLPMGALTFVRERHIARLT